MDVRQRRCTSYVMCYSVLGPPEIIAIAGYLVNILEVNEWDCECCCFKSIFVRIGELNGPPDLER